MYVFIAISTIAVYCITIYYVWLNDHLTDIQLLKRYWYVYLGLGFGSFHLVMEYHIFQKPKP